MTWDQLAAGHDCPVDPPRAESAEWDVVLSMPASTLCLLRNQTFRGHCILIYDRRHATRIDQLTTVEWTEYSQDLHRASIAIATVCRPDHMNVESLGNQMPHLHWHIVPRYRTDPRWGHAIWPPPAESMPSSELTPEARDRLIHDLRRAAGGAADETSPDATGSVASRSR